MTIVNKDKVDNHRVGQTYAQRRELEKARQPEIDNQALPEITAQKDNFEKNPVRNPWRFNPNVSLPAKKFATAGKDLDLMVVEEGAKGAGAKISNKSCIDFLDQILANPKVHTQTAIRKNVREESKK